MNKTNGHSIKQKIKAKLKEKKTTTQLLLNKSIKKALKKSLRKIQKIKEQTNQNKKAKQRKRLTQTILESGKILIIKNTETGEEITKQDIDDMTIDEMIEIAQQIIKDLEEQLR